MSATENIKYFYEEIDEFIDTLNISEVEKDDFVSLLKATIEAVRKEAFDEGFTEGQDSAKFEIKDAAEDLQKAVEDFIDEI